VLVLVLVLALVLVLVLVLGLVLVLVCSCSRSRYPQPVFRFLRSFCRRWAGSAHTLHAECYSERAWPNAWR